MIVGHIPAIKKKSSWEPETENDNTPEESFSFLEPTHANLQKVFVNLSVTTANFNGI